MYKATLLLISVFAALPGFSSAHALVEQWLRESKLSSVADAYLLQQLPCSSCLARENNKMQSTYGCLGVAPLMCPTEHDDDALLYRSGAESESKCKNQTDCRNVDIGCITCMNSVQRVAGWLNSTYLRWVTNLFVHSLCRISPNGYCESGIWAIMDKTADSLINGPFAVQICRFTGTCASDSPHTVRRGFVCNVCELLMGLVIRRLADTVTVEEMKRVASQICSVLPAHETEAIAVCKRTILEAYIKMTTMLEKEEATHILCELLGTCRPDFQPTPPPATPMPGI